MSVRLEPRTAHLDDEAARRVRLTVAVDDCDALPKVPDAGEVVQRDGRQVQVMHNGVVVEAGGYFGDWMAEIVRCLRGHHEPQEELVFARVLEHLRATGLTAPRVVELGAFWAYYSLWALQEFPDAQVVLLEPDPANLELGKRNLALNGRTATVVHGVMGREPGATQEFGNLDGSVTQVRQYDLEGLLQETGLDRVDLLLCDVQGGEQFLFTQAGALLRSGRVRFAVVSTHHHSISGDALTHQRLLRELVQLGAHVVVEHTVGESCSGDGLIVVSFDPADADLVVHTSRVRQGDSLFGPPEEELAAALVARTTADEAAQAERREAERLREGLAGATARLQQAEVERAAAQGDLVTAQAELASVRAELHRLLASRLWRSTSGARAGYARLRAAAGR